MLFVSRGSGHVVRCVCVCEVRGGGGGGGLWGIEPMLITCSSFFLFLHEDIVGTYIYICASDEYP